MREEILAKLTARLDRAPASEDHVVYTLIEIRKLLEREGRRDQFETLAFFCDWAAHPVLDRRGAHDQISRLDARLSNLDLTDLDDVGPDMEIYRFISFEGLLEELQRFCEEMHLPNGWTNHPASWRECVKFYGEIVRGCALEVKRPSNHPKSIRTVVLRTVGVLPAEGDVESLRLEWEFGLNDGSCFKQSVNFRYPSVHSAAWRGGPTTAEFGF